MLQNISDVPESIVSTHVHCSLFEALHSPEIPVVNKTVAPHHGSQDTPGTSGKCLRFGCVWG